MTAENQIENLMLSIAKKSVLKTLCPLLSVDLQFPKPAFTLKRLADARTITEHRRAENSPIDPKPS
jgi:hypothetical protein